ncbi:sugar-binding transcriptional regulator [Microbacterium thalli]|uniref:Sugar-binding domain-containing protein n=1 Tax=Microbacterium thalli TaxID=3027921 RepID=A0ABT5SH81_9MICO|nr:sugar-binding domain-containing protein [Microbacterium thalli]MDD7928661.1 sugar-binding domain-containing protein [Microbacterium thalli]MDD7961248.1 sugar-binding domain-containing protein [Microbacterium thalli]MDN8550028.1 sugar-binding domain-containing protein [Microbacterium thalli]
MSADAEADARTRDALHAAQLYYVQDQTMDQIAAEMTLSRSSVSRLLSHARDIGLVEITVHSPQEANSVVARRLSERFGISVHVVSTPPRSTDAERLERTARTAAHVLASTLDPDASIGIAWGATVSAIARHLPTKRLHDSQIVQMNGAANESTSGISYSGAILERFGQAFGTDVQQFPVPALFDDPLTKQLLWRERSIRRVLDAQSRVQVFVFGLGSPQADVPSHVYAGGYLTGDDLRGLLRDGVVGDCATVFYRLDGSATGIELNARSSGPSLESIRRIPRRLCAVSSLSKLDALRGALAAGLITELVVEESLARRVAETTVGSL